MTISKSFFYHKNVISHENKIKMISKYFRYALQKKSANTELQIGGGRL